MGKSKNIATMSTSQSKSSAASLKSVADNDNFQRNSKGKYATLPAMPKRWLENDDSSTKCDTNSSKVLRSSNQTFSSNNDNSSKDGAVSEGEVESHSMSRKNDATSLKSSVKILQNTT